MGRRNSYCLLLPVAHVDQGGIEHGEDNRQKVAQSRATLAQVHRFLDTGDKRSGDRRDPVI